MIHRMQNLNNWHVFYILVFITLATSIGSGFLNPELADRAWWSGFLQNFSTEMMGAIATFALFELVIEARKRTEDKQEAIDKEKTTLIIQMGSKDNATAITAVEQLHMNGWLEDGSLKGMVSDRPNLSDAHLWKANLSDVEWFEANLSGANLGEANLSDAHLFGSNLSGAEIDNANLSGANLSEANLKHADLSGANLSGTNLKHANMFSVQCDENTTLPDSTKWTVETHWSQFGAVVIEYVEEWQAYRKEQGLDKKIERSI